MWCVHGLQGRSSLRKQREEKQLQVLMASKHQELEAEVWHQYHASRTRENAVRGQVWHELHRPQEKDISPSLLLAGEQGGSPGMGAAAMLWPLGRAGLFSLPAGLHVAPWKELAPGPRLKPTVGRDTGSWFCGCTSLQRVSITALRTKPSPVQVRTARLKP